MGEVEQKAHTHAREKKMAFLTHSGEQKNDSAQAEDDRLFRVDVFVLTVVPGRSVPEEETCRVLHRCGGSALRCAWAP